MIAGIFAIIVGFTLLTTFLVFLELIPMSGDNLEEEAERLGIFQGAIGIIAIGIGIWSIGNWIWIFLIVAGVTGALGLLVWIPEMKKYLDKVIKGVGSAQTIIGVLSINAGILALLG